VDYAQIVYGLWTDYVWVMYGYAWIIHQLCMDDVLIVDYAWLMPGLCMDDACLLFGLCMDSA